MVRADDAQHRLLQLLDQVEQGESITITRNGVPVAVLSPYQPPRREVGETIDAIREFRRGLSLGGVTVREAIEEGRR